MTRKKTVRPPKPDDAPHDVVDSFADDAPDPGEVPTSLTSGDAAAPDAETTADALETAADEPETPVEQPETAFVAEAKAAFDRLDERERAARALNCLLHGHPAGIVVEIGGSGVFCPHCCTYLAEPGS